MGAPRPPRSLVSARSIDVVLWQSPCTPFSVAGPAEWSGKGGGDADPGSVGRQSEAGDGALLRPFRRAGLGSVRDGRRRLGTDAQHLGDEGRDGRDGRYARGRSGGG